MWNIISILCIVMLLCIFAIFLESRRETHSLKITRYTVSASSLPPQFDGCRIMLFADMHNSFFPDGNREIWECIQEFKPDFFLLAGDMIVCSANAEEKNLRTADFIRELSRYGDCYYGFGNHETGVAAGIRGVGDMWEHYVQALGIFGTAQADCMVPDGKPSRADCAVPDKKPSRAENHIYLMDNQSVILRRNNASVVLTGLNLGMEYYKRLSDIKLTAGDMDRLIGKCDNSFYNILIAHHPDYFEAYAAWGADLVVSGHNHGGLLRLPLLGGVISPRLNLFPKYDRGIYNCNDATMILSGGMGAHSVRIRVNNRPELICLELKQGR